MDTLPDRCQHSQVIDKLTTEFAPFLGAPTRAIVTGLRSGTPITLTPRTTINPPTGKMGLGDIFISLALAKQQLSHLGIKQPTPEQLLAILVGGPIVRKARITVGTGLHIPGILTLRSQNMGWGQISQELGFKKLDPIVRGLTIINKGPAGTALLMPRSKGRIHRKTRG
jgi:hypothetical protein